MTQKLVNGVYTALLTPRNSDDSVDIPALRTLIEFQMAQGVSSFAVNGATGEFCLTTPQHLRVMLATVNEASDGRANILCGVGAAGTSLVIEYASIAQNEQVQALLLPMPFFFPYRQEDLDAFCRTVAGATSLPILLYNLPQFTSGLHQDTVRTLIQEVPNIIGIKDSSGLLDILRDLTAHRVEACRIIGNDSVLAAALSEGVCDGVVSGVACVLPEVILALYDLQEQIGSAQFAQTADLLSQFVEQLNPFPTPWGLKWIAEARNVLQARFAQPVGAHRLTQSRAIMEWFKTWHAHAVHTLASNT